MVPRRPCSLSLPLSSSLGAPLQLTLKQHKQTLNREIKKRQLFARRVAVGVAASLEFASRVAQVSSSLAPSPPQPPLLPPAALAAAYEAAYDAAAAGVASSTGLPPANRAAPEWGKTIFSRHCALTRPADSQAYLQWAAYALTLHDAHLRLADEALTVGGAWAWGGEGGGGDAALADTAAAHARYAACQLANAKTRRVLEVAFGAGWAGEYMEGCMFDVEEGG